MLWNYKNHKTYCRCICDCGAEVIKNKSDIVQENVKSCGCLKTELVQDRCRIDITGQKFNKLTVLEMLWYYKEKRTFCKCLCDCGNEIIVDKVDVVSGHTQSCGCYQKSQASTYNTKDFTNVVSEYGVQFIEPVYQNKKNQWLWKVKCGLCGKEFIALPAKVLNGNITSCGCARQSKRERYIETFLFENDINYKLQYRFKDCKYKYTLPFDFALLSDNKVKYLIEYDGEQHYRSVSYFGGEKSFIKTKLRDNIKNTYCEENNISLLRLPYTLTDEEIKKQIINIMNP